MSYILATTQGFSSSLSGSSCDPAKQRVFFLFCTCWCLPVRDEGTRSLKVLHSLLLDDSEIQMHEKQQQQKKKKERKKTSLKILEEVVKRSVEASIDLKEGAYPKYSLFSNYIVLARVHQLFFF